jgi:hypothetical protein
MKVVHRQVGKEEPFSQTSSGEAVATPTVDTPPPHISQKVEREQHPSDDNESVYRK